MIFLKVSSVVAVSARDPNNEERRRRRRIFTECLKHFSHLAIVFYNKVKPYHRNQSWSETE